MEIINISKSYINEYYNGNIKKAIEAKDGIIYTENNIISAFCGCVSPKTIKEATKQLQRFINDNKSNSIFYDIENKVFL